MKNNILGERIKSIRTSKNLSRDRLGATIGLAGNTLYKIETGLTMPNIETVVKIAKTLNVPVAYLIGEIDDPEIPKPNNEIPDFIKERLTKLDSIESENLPDHLEKIGRELMDLAKKLKHI